jgi:hypothetical protein
MSPGFAPPTAALPTRVASRPERDLPRKTATRTPPIVSQALAPAPRGVRMLSKASEIPRAVALVVATGYQGAATGAIGSCWLSYSGCLGHYQNILDRRSTWIMANRHFGKIAESGSMPRWPRCWSESLQAGYAETT